MSAPDYEDLLLRTSRTFALSIPLLEEPVRRQVTLAYLLFRIADTFEDASVWPKDARRDGLLDFCAWLDELPPEEDARATLERWLDPPPTDHEGYLDLLRHTVDVVGAYRELEPVAREAVRLHTQRTCRGMAEFVERAHPDGSLELRDLADLKNYCYVVAGIVGEMLTDLFLASSAQLQPIEARLREKAATFGEALQLVNILKDRADDREEGRTFLPPSVDRDDVFALARRDLEVARSYVLLLQEAGAPRGDVAFTALPVRLAQEALDVVESEGAGAKVGRGRVLEIVKSLHEDLDAARPAV
ncbi:MAG: squalene/phytoene synthase family protein [Acidobacteriota bacterium]